jgi:hypothetical protein
MTKKYFYSFIFYAFVIFLYISCASAPKNNKPLWADTDTINQIYPAEDYIAKTGCSTVEENAATIADGELSNYFSHQITSITKAYQRMTDNADDQTDNREIQRSVFIESSIKLFAVAHTLPWFDKSLNRYICCSYIDRKEAWKIYESTVIQAQKNFLSLYKAADDEADPLKRCILLQNCKPSAEEYTKVLDFAHILYDSGEKIYTADRDKISSIDKELNETRMNAVMHVIVKNDKEGAVDRKLSSLLSNEGYMFSDREYAYIVQAVIETNKTKYADSVTADPGITVTINNGTETVFSYSKNLPRISGFLQAETLVDKKIYSAVEKELDASFVSEFQAALR